MRVASLDEAASIFSRPGIQLFDDAKFCWPPTHTVSLA
jgi:hypothetical protein